MNSEQAYDLAVGRLFSARKCALVLAVALTLLSMIAGRSAFAAYTVLVLVIVFVTFILLTWLYIYRITQSLHGTGYALGHLAISVMLTPIFLLGIILVPLLVRGDVQRLS